MTAKRVLVVDDEPSIHRFLKPVLEVEGYVVLRADTGEAGLACALDVRPDIVILDLGLPDMDGKSVLTELRRYVTTPVVILSARDREAEKIDALDLGANDFVNKPFSVGELLARLRAALRSVAPSPAPETVLRFGDLEIDLARHRVTRCGAEVRLARKEFDLLVLLAGNAGTVLTHRRLLTEIWGAGHAEDTHYLRVYIGQIRQKLGDEGDSRLIVTEPGIGYRFRDAV